MADWIKDSYLGKIGEMATLQSLNDHSYGTEADWETTQLYHIDTAPNGKHEGIVKHLQERGGDILQVEEQKTDKRRITFHEVKTQTGTYGIYPLDKKRLWIIEIFEWFRSKERHKVDAGLGNIVIEIYGNGIKHSQEMLKKVSEATDPFSMREAGSYWKYKKILGDMPADNEHTEYGFMIWFYLIQAKQKPYGEKNYKLKGDSPAQLIGIPVKKLIEIVEKKLKSSTSADWKLDEKKTAILVIPLNDFVSQPDIMGVIDQTPKQSFTRMIAGLNKKPISDYEVSDQTTGEIQYRMPFQNHIDGINHHRIIDKPQLGMTREEATKYNGKEYEFDGKIFKIYEAIGTKNYKTSEEEGLSKLTELLKECGILPDDI